MSIRGHGYRPGVARVCTRLYRPVRDRGHASTRIDHFAAWCWTHLDLIAYRHFGSAPGVKAFGIERPLLLRTRGRHTGQVREVLVAFIEFEGSLVVCGANAGGERAPSWYVNLRSGGPVEVEVAHERHQMDATLLEGERRRLAFAQLCAAFPQLCLYESRTDRTFPVVALATHAERGKIPRAGDVACHEVLVA